MQYLLASHFPQGFQLVVMQPETQPLNRRGGRMKKLLVGVLVSIFLSMLASVSIAAPDFKKCDELKGAAWGLCRGAIAGECDTTKSPGCAQIAVVVEQITGQPSPTWNCPCGTWSDFSFIINASSDTSALVCNVTVSADGSKTLEIENTANPNLIFSFFPGSYPKQTCGWNNTSQFTLTDDEASACVNEVRLTADYLGIVCPK